MAAATRAPSIHNTQPWRFRASDDRLDVFLDRDRALPVLDPTGRQQIISCGTAVEFAVLALAAQGRSAEVTLLPDDAAPDHLAGVRATGGGAAAEDELAIGRRHTVRAPFLSRALPTAWSSGSSSRPGASVPGSSRSTAPRRRSRQSS